MRRMVLFPFALLLLSGCGKDEKHAQVSRTVSLDELAVTVRDHARSYFFSDKHGGFLVGTAGQGAEQKQEWSVNGQVLLHDIGSLTIDGKPVDRSTIDSVKITPLEAVRFYHDGMVETVMPLDQVLGEKDAHGIALQVQMLSSHTVTFSAVPGSDFVPVPHREPRSICFQKAPKSSLAYSGGAQGEITPDGISIGQASSAVFVLIYAQQDSADYLAERMQGEIELLRQARLDRMEKLLDRAFIRTSDTELTKALRWLQLALDGLTICDAETVAVPALPWNGAINVRDNAVALAGLDVALGDYETTAAMLRALARHVDISADEGGWFARQMYEHITASGDTALARDLYPVVRANLERTAKLLTDRSNLLIQENPLLHGLRSSDQQALWYFQQSIGSIFGLYLGDTASAARWAHSADVTASAFNQTFVDTSRNLVFDRISPLAKDTNQLGAGSLFCLDMIESEQVRANTIKAIMRAFLRPDGIVTYAQGKENGARTVQNWMEGQMVYALTRYDCQHISYPVTRRLASRIINADMVGVLPEMYGSNDGAGPLGAAASLVAMGEFVRSFYQDYLGVHVNMTTRSLTLEPKLPAELSEVDFTIFAGRYPVIGRYERLADKDRVILKGEGLEDTVKISFVWMMKNGDAWRGVTSLLPGKTTILAFGDRDATVLFDGKEAPMESARHLNGFSQRASMEGL